MEISRRNFERVSRRRHANCCNWTLTTPSTVKVLWRSCESLVVFLDSELWSNKSVNITWNMDRHEWKSSKRLKVPASFLPGKVSIRQSFISLPARWCNTAWRREVTCWAFDIEMRSMEYQWHDLLCLISLGFKSALDVAPRSLNRLEFSSWTRRNKAVGQICIRPHLQWLLRAWMLSNALECSRMLFGQDLLNTNFAQRSNTYVESCATQRLRWVISDQLSDSPASLQSCDMCLYKEWRELSTEGACKRRRLYCSWQTVELYIAGSADSGSIRHLHQNLLAKQTRYLVISFAILQSLSASLGITWIISMKNLN